MATTKLTKLAAACCATAFLAGCEASPTWFSEAGSGLDEGGFGNPTMNNTQVMNGDLNYVISLAKRFSEEVPNTVNFAFDSAVLDDSAKLTLRHQADWIRQFPEVRFRVYGYTDLVGSASYNKGLGMRRAQAAVAYLSTLGISRSRLEAVVSYGETHPLIEVPTRERRNRRAVTEVSGFVGNNPMVLNGKYAEVIFREYVQSATFATSLDTTTLAGSN